MHKAAFTVLQPLTGILDSSNRDKCRLQITDQEELVRPLCTDMYADQGVQFTV